MLYAESKDFQSEVEPITIALESSIPEDTIEIAQDSEPTDNYTN